MASVRVEVKSGTAMGAKQDEIESAVGRIQTFPGGAERPQIREMTNAHSMIRLILYGDVPERSLKELAHRIEDDLAALPSVSQVAVHGGSRCRDGPPDVPGARANLDPPALGFSPRRCPGRSNPHARAFLN